MSCHGRPDGAPLTLKGLVHELTADWTLADESVIVSGWDSAGGVVLGVGREQAGEVVEDVLLLGGGDRQAG